jgi:hypothetical protein
MHYPLSPPGAPGFAQVPRGAPARVGRAFHRPCLQCRRRTQEIQCAITQPIGLALAVFRKLDDPLGGCCSGWVGSFDPKGYACHFECDAHDAPRFSIEAEAVQVGG